MLKSEGKAWCSTKNLNKNVTKSDCSINSFRGVPMTLQPRNTLWVRQTGKDAGPRPTVLQLILLAFRVKEDLVGVKTER